MVSGILPQIGSSQFKKGSGRRQPILLKMNERACQLDQPLIEEIIGLAPLFQPQLLEDVMGFIKSLVIEIFKIAQVMSIQAGPGSLKGGYQL